MTERTLRTCYGVLMAKKEATERDIRHIRNQMKNPHCEASVGKALANKLSERIRVISALEEVVSELGK